MRFFLNFKVMNLTEYKSGDFSKQSVYMSFSSHPINKEWGINNPEIDSLLEEANLKLGELKAFSTFCQM